VVNELVGCADDLACYDNGFVFSTHNELAEILKKLMGNPEMIKRMGNASLEKIKEYSYGKTIENLLKIK
jgi:glycosyltransferase involved in cell wall biosynthesis